MKSCLLGALSAGLLRAFLASSVDAAQAPARPTAPVTQAPSGQVDLELVILVDSSPSIDVREARLQRQGFATAFRTPEVIRAIQAGALGKIAVVYIDWSSDPYTRVITNWRIVQDATTANALADTLLRTQLTFGNGTSISGALELAALMLDTNTLRGTRRTIDISGDGPNNRGRTVLDARNDIVAKGITINGLPIITGEYGVGDWGIYFLEIDKYYANCVIGGRGSFALPARGFQDFASAVRRKLVLEISGIDPQTRLAARTPLMRVAAAPQPLQPSAPLRPAGPQAPRENCVSGFGFDGQF